MSIHRAIIRLDLHYHHFHGNDFYNVTEIQQSVTKHLAQTTLINEYNQFPIRA